MAYEFSGVVYVDETPLPEARLNLSGGPSQQSFPTVFTDGQGAFSFTGLEDGTYSLNITPPDNRPDVPASSNNSVTINGADKTQDFVLLTGGGGVLSGEVRWADGTLAEGVNTLSVYLYREDESGNYPHIQSPTYGAIAPGGKFSVTVSPGTYRLGVDMNMAGGQFFNGIKYADFSISRYGGYYDGAGNFIYPLVENLVTQVTVGEAAVGDVSVSLPEYVEISGKVADENGVGVSDVRLEVTGCIRDPNDNSAETMCMNPIGFLSMQTDSEGNYIFAIPVHDDWDITLTPPAGSGVAKKTLLSQDFSASQTGLNFQLGALPVLSGEVRWADGTLAEGVNTLSVYLYREDESGNYPHIQSPTYGAIAPGGKFSVTVSPGTYRLGVDMNMAGGQFFNGIKYADFSISRYGGYYDGAGNFIYPLVENLVTQVTVGEAAVGDVSVSLPEYVEISGKVADENGVGVSDVRLEVTGCIRDPNDNSAETMCMNPIGFLSMQTDSEGNYIFAIPVHDDWDITLTPPAGSGVAKKTLLSQDFSASQTGLNFQLGALPVLSGEVRWADGTLAEGVNTLSVYLYREDESGNYPHIQSPTYGAIAPGGKFSVTVSPGTYRLGVDMNMAGGQFFNGIKYADFSISRYGGYYDGAGNFIYPLVENLVTQVTVGEAAVGDVSVSLPEYVEISGKVADENGVGVSDVRLEVTGCIRDPNDNSAETMCMNPIGFLSMQTDSEGNYIFAIPVHDDWDITLTPPAGSGFTASSLTGFDFSVPSSKVFVMNLLDTIAPRFLSQPVIKNLTDKAAVVAWQTNEPTLSNVSGTGFASVTTNQYRVSHEATLTGLSHSRAYTANVAIADRAGNGPERATVSFTTPAAPDRAPPVITSGPIIASASDNAAVVRWTTDEPALTVLKWGVGVAGNVLQLDNTYRTEHEITLSGLSQLTDYEVQASATDFEGNGPTVSAKIIFRTLASPDTTAPEIIAGPFVANISDTEATISWVTNEPAVSGVSANDGTEYLVYLDENLATKHEVRLTELAANTTYFYTVSATDDTGNGPTLSDEDSFLTLSGKDTDPPEITEGLKILGITHQSAVVQFKTDEPAAAQVRYGTNSAELDQFTTDAKLATNHVVHLTDLEQNRIYIIEVVVTDSAGNTAVVAGGEMTTLALPAGAGPKFTAAPTVLLSGDTRALIKWETDEAAECYVTFQKAGDLQQLRVDIAGSKTRHQAMLTDLEIGATYNFDVTCRNEAGFSTTYISAQAARSTGPSASGSFRSVIGEPARARIIGVSVAHRAADRLVLRVQTDKPSTIETRYGPSAKNKRQSVSSPRYETEHVMVLNNLQANTAHHITIKARDITGSLTQSTLSNQITSASYDTNAPGLSGAPTLKSLAVGEITISFTGSEYAVSEVSCAASNGAGTWTSGSERLQREHQLLLKGLRRNSTYRCRIKQVDTSGNIGQSGDYTLALGQGGPEGAPNKPDITKTEYEEGKIVLHVSLSGTGNSGLATYTAYCDTGTQVVTASSTGSPVTVTGLDSNKSYTCSVTATNSNGYVSEPSKATNSITPAELNTGLPVWLLYEASRQSR